MKKEGENKITKKNVQLLLDISDIDSIESAIVRLFILNNGIINIRNKLIKEKIKSSDENTFIKIETFFKEHNLGINLKNIERIFELLIEEKERKINGAFYTPQFIVDYIVKKVITKTGTVCDPSCGSGAFLVTATERLKKLSKLSYVKTIEKYVYGVDISKRSIERTKLILSLLCLSHGEDKEEIHFNIIIKDSLSMDWQGTFPDIFRIENWDGISNVQDERIGFDFIIGNPPYVRIQNLNDKTKEIIKKKWSSAKKYNIDLYIPFIELSIYLIKKTGKISLITAKSYLDSAAGYYLRNLLKKNKYIEEILNFNFFQIFDDVITYTNIITLNKLDKESIRYYKVKMEEELQHLEKIKFTQEYYKDLPENKIIINGHKDSINIKKIKGQNIKIGDKYPVKVGIATLKDELYFVEKKNGKYIKETSNQTFEIEEGIVKKILFANKILSKKTNEVFGWIIFPYKLIENRYKPIPEYELKKEFPSCYKYFQDVKQELMGRDKGRDRVNDYGEWYAYGRVQGYNAIGSKLVFPSMMPEQRFKELTDNSLFIAGYAIMCGNDLKWLKRIFNSSVFWYYATKEGKKIRNDFYVINKNIIDNFSIPEFTSQEKKYLMTENNMKKISAYLTQKYGLIF